MYGKIFDQIFDSSIAEEYLTRLVFMDLVILADPDGVVDITVEALARRTNVPLEIVLDAIRKLEQPDENSRSNECEGRRIVRLDDIRPWGWKIVNHSVYRSFQSAGLKREYFRDYQRHRRSIKRKLALLGEATGEPLAPEAETALPPVAGLGDPRPAFAQRQSADHIQTLINANNAEGHQVQPVKIDPMFPKTLEVTGMQVRRAWQKYQRDLQAGGKVLPWGFWRIVAVFNEDKGREDTREKEKEKEDAARNKLAVKLAASKDADGEAKTMKGEWDQLSPQEKTGIILAHKARHGVATEATAMSEWWMNRKKPAE